MNLLPSTIKNTVPTLVSRVAFILLFMFMAKPGASAQNMLFNYKVVNNGNTIGWVKIQTIKNNNHSSIVLTSEVKRRIIFLLTVEEKQDSYYNESGMVNSSIYRKVNDNVKMNQQVIYKGNHYEIRNPKSSGKVAIQQIQYNLLNMYTKEPVNIAKVYSETFLRYLAIEPQGKHIYKLQLPDGNTNYYHYQDGICSRVVMEHSLFTIEFVKV